MVKKVAVRRKIEEGAAEMTVKLSKGLIVVKHSDGTVLIKRRAYEGDWNRIFDALRK